MALNLNFWKSAWFLLIIYHLAFNLSSEGVQCLVPVATRPYSLSLRRLRSSKIINSDVGISDGDRSDISETSCIQFLNYSGSFPWLDQNQWSLLETYAEKLLEWNSKINLISRKDTEYLIPRHIVPCMCISLVYRFGAGESIADIGSGGGIVFCYL